MASQGLWLQANPEYDDDGYDSEHPRGEQGPRPNPPPAPPPPRPSNPSPDTPDTPEKKDTSWKYGQFYARADSTQQSNYSGYRNSDGQSNSEQSSIPPGYYPQTAAASSPRQDYQHQSYPSYSSSYGSSYTGSVYGQNPSAYPYSQLSTTSATQFTNYRQSQSSTGSTSDGRMAQPSQPYGSSPRGQQISYQSAPQGGQQFYLPSGWPPVTR